ncbi:hypothetical protein DL96DRAFT_209870 [Flagelloscypha sp. PMI_526]|nr:hypothetical protein DL96DRAFT_209870 [Flagelloscypha sp. PMI_526]
MSNIRSHSLQVVLVGDGDVGQTTLIQRFAEGKYHEYSPCSVGSMTRNIEVPGMGTVELLVVDTGGGEDYGRLRCRAHLLLCRDALIDRQRLNRMASRNPASPSRSTHHPRWL